MNTSEIIDILMKRDGLTYVEAARQVNDFAIQLNYLITHGGTICDAEDALQETLGLEIDYLPTLLQ